MTYDRPMSPPGITGPVYGAVAAKVAEWAESHPDIRAVIVVGSFARPGGMADTWSDLDLIVFADDPAAFVADSTWLQQFGAVLAPKLSDHGRGTPEWLVLYEDGSKIDFMFAAAGGNLAHMLGAFPYQDVLRRGVRVLVNKTPSPGSLPPPAPPAPEVRPSADAFANTIYGALIAADKTARLLRRGDPWRAKMLCDAEIKGYLLDMLAWHAQATEGHDTWYDGRFLDHWADPRALAALPSCFAAYEASDLWRATEATLDLFAWLAAETAQRWGFVLPAAAIAATRRRLRQMRPAGDAADGA